MKMYVSEIMTTGIVAEEPQSTAEHAAEMMSEHNIGALPVTQSREIVGIVTDRDIVLRCLAKGLDPKKTTVGDIMSRCAVCISPHHTIDDVVHIMSREQIRRLPVADNGNLVGMISMADIARIRHGLEAAVAISEISRP